MIWVFSHYCARSGIFVSIVFIIFDLATGLLLGVVFQMAMLLGYVLLGIVTGPPYRAYVQKQQRYERELEMEGDRLQRQIAELERELGIGDQP